MAETELLPSNLNSLKRTDLQKWCKQFGLKASGKNAELIERLQAFAQDQRSNESEEQNSIEDLDQIAAEEKVLEESVIEPTDTLEEVEQTEQLEEEEQEEQAVEEPIEVPETEAEHEAESASHEEAAETESPLVPVVEEETDPKEAIETSLESSECKVDKLTAIPAKAASLKNFDAIHKKTFSRMESIASHYAAKRLQTEDNKTPLMKGQTQSASSTKRKSSASPPPLSQVQASYKKTKTPSLIPVQRKENTKPVRHKFDLQASLARPLTYKPYSGPIKQLPADKPVSLHSAEIQRKQPMNETLK